VKGHITINGELCKECGLCIMCCKHGVITKSDAYNAKGYFPALFVDPEEKCNACQTCALVCAEVAIEVYRG